MGVIVARSDFDIATMYQNVRYKRRAIPIRCAMTGKIGAMKLPQTDGCLCGKICYEITEALQLV